MDATGMAVLLGIIVLLGLIGFMAAWRRDAKRSEKVADNPERVDTRPEREQQPGRPPVTGRKTEMATILWLIAVVLVIAGIVQIVRGGLIPGIVIIVVGLLIGPGGVSLFT